MLLREQLDAASVTARICADGCLVAEVPAARTGIQTYRGTEVDPDNAHGLKDAASVNVYRPAEEVFSRDSLASFSAAPITINHPSEMVDAGNWRRLGVGEINGDIIRDGERVRVPLIVRDAGAVQKAQTTHKQLSMGYATKLVFPSDGKHPDGTACDAYQTEIRVNHIALVPAARGGPELRIVDERKPLHLLTDGIGDAKAWLKKAIALHKKHMDGTAPTTGPAGEKSQMLMMEQMKNALAELEGGGMKSGMKMDCYPFHIHDQEKPVKTMLIDGLTVDIANADTAQATIATILAARDGFKTDLATANTTIAAKDTEIATLKTENQQLKDAKPTPAQLRDAAKSYAQTCDKAKALGVDVTDAMDEPAIMKAVVAKVMGDAAQGWNDAQIAASFAVATKDAKPATVAITPLGQPANMQDAAGIRDWARSRRNLAA